MHEQFVVQENVDRKMSVLSLLKVQKPNRDCASLKVLSKSEHCSILSFVFSLAYSKNKFFFPRL